MHDIAFQDFDFELGIASVPALMVEVSLSNYDEFHKA